MKNTTKFLAALAVLLVAAPFMLAADGYSDFPRDVQTKNIPAGVVNEPGSQLIFLLDTGIDAKALYQGDPKAPNANYQTKSVTELSGGALVAPNFPNFLSITNTNPTDAVTVHFRYTSSYRKWNANAKSWSYFCEDILDFLVVLTCNDTMLIDPFNYDIPGTVINTSEIFFGASSGAFPNAIKGEQFDDGRFFLFVTASGDLLNDNDDYADWLFPKELAPKASGNNPGLLDHCTGVDQTKIGTSNGISDNNLHILNASAISFNYLTGFSTIAVPTAFIDPGAPGNDLAYGVVAYARPAVDLSLDTNVGHYLAPDGDGPQAPKGVVLSGTESIPLTNAAHFGAPLPGGITDPGYVGSTPNRFYLRNEVHAGDVDGGISLGGALAWTLFEINAGQNNQGVLPVNQFIFFVSMVDDYNGSDNPKKQQNPLLPFNDNAYAFNAAETIYDLLVYDNEENRLELPPPDVPISPPPPQQPISLVIRILCFDAFDGEYITEFDDFSVEDMFSLTGGGLVEDWLDRTSVPGGELGPGWIRIERIQTVMFNASTYDGVRPTFLTIGQQVTRFEGFGVSWWLPTSARIEGLAF